MSVERCWYWDASAILPLFVQDKHTPRSERAIKSSGVHILSSLAIAEVLGVFARINGVEILLKRDEFLKEIDDGCWSLSHTAPLPETLKKLVLKYKLRGADLWHLAAASDLKRELPELALLSFDQALSTAAQAEGLG